jgi:hypothetical protein
VSIGAAGAARPVIAELSVDPPSGLSIPAPTPAGGLIPVDHPPVEPGEIVVAAHAGRTR